MRKLTSLKTACVALAFCAATIAASAQTFTTLASFNSAFNSPFPGLIQGFDGNFYGTAIQGTEYCLPDVLFKMTPIGGLTSPFAFPPGDCVVTLLQASNGNFYGAISQLSAAGSIFELTPTGTLTTLYSFCAQSSCADGSAPLGIVQGADGNFYGTTFTGGANNLGTFFEISPAGNLATLHSFTASEVRAGTLWLQAADGNFYGTSNNGIFNSPGAVFEITAAGQVTTLYSFCSVGDCLDGASPNSLIQATDGNIYGTTFSGGRSELICYLGGCGTIFRITPAGKLRTLHNFNVNDSAAPNSLLQATDGNIYGTTAGDGVYSRLETGSVFEFKPRSGVLTTLHFFSYIDGSIAQGLMQATNGSFYGTTRQGGPSLPQVGTVFSVSTGLAPFVETLPTSGRVGSKVVILGNSLTGTTAVSFNGKSARFTVISDTEITAEVPAGATTGIVKVGTPGGTLSSNVIFQVTP